MTDKNKNNEYKVLARKYRPQTFKDLIGQEILVKILTNSIIENRIAHAYLLTGVRGIGKTTTARLIAMSLNCEKRLKDTCEPCGTCESCSSIREDSNLDVLEIDAASKTGVDDIRELIENVKYKPVVSPYKIFIIDEVHMLSKNAFNALLKTLEEPPDHVKFIFATTEVKKIPITILSRCQRFDLHRIGNEKLISHLLDISKKENIIIKKEALALIVRYADGSMRDGLSLLDQAIVNGKDQISSETIVEMLGLADRANVFDLIEKIFAGQAPEALEIYNRIYRSGADVVMIFDEMLNIVHFITQIKIASEFQDDIHIPELERKRGSEISAKISLASLGMVWQVLFKGYEELQSGYHLFQHGEMLIIRLIYLYEGPTPDDLVKMTKSQNFKESNAILDNQTSPSNNIEKKIVNELKFENRSENISKSENIKLASPKGTLSIDSYRKFVDLFHHRREAMLYTYLYNDVKMISFKEGEVVINIKAISDPHFSRTIAKLVSKWTGRIWQVSTSTSNIGKTLYEEDLLEQQKEIQKMKNDPAIKNILEKFPGSRIHSITNIDETTEDKILTENIKKTEEK